MDITIQHIRKSKRHLYYEDGPVRMSHLLKSVAERCQDRRVSARLTGLATPSSESNK